MLCQIIEDGLFRELILILNFSASLIFIYLAFQLSKKIKEAKLLSTTTGLALYLANQGLSHFAFFFSELYPELTFSVELKDITALCFILSMVVFIILTEISQSLYDSNQKKKKFRYPLSIFSILGVSIAYPLVIIMKSDYLPIFLIILVPFLISCLQFVKKFESLEIVKRSKIIPLFFIGWAIAGFVNLLKSNLFKDLFGLGIWVWVWIPLCYICGGFMMTWSWKRLPNLSELDWMLKMERLMVIHRDSSGTIFVYDFQTSSHAGSNQQVEETLAGSAIGGIDALLSEILASKGHINEIDHGNKKIFFSHGIATECVLFATGSSAEFKYRLEMFHLSFEKKFGHDTLLNWNGEVTQFSKAYELILRYFYQ